MNRMHLLTFVRYGEARIPMATSANIEALRLHATKRQRPRSAVKQLAMFQRWKPTGADPDGWEVSWSVKVPDGEWVIEPVERV